MPLTPFAHVHAEKSSLYRGVMQVFVAAKERFLLHLRPEDVHERLGGAAREEVERAQALEDLRNGAPPSLVAKEKTSLPEAER
jgi:hypothetical protein